LPVEFNHSGSSGMVTLRTYSNSLEASLAKARLEEHEIPCTLADENANLYGGGPLAMPVRLLVADDKAEEANRILASSGPQLPDDVEMPSEITSDPAPAPSENAQLLHRLEALQKHNRWIVLISFAILGMTIYLVSELPRATSGAWGEVSQAMRQYDYPKALYLAHQISDAHPNDYYGHEYLGNIYSALGDWANAETEYARAYDLAPPMVLKQKLDAVRRRRAEPASSPSPMARP
jgi:tetratricopeptide (TPR) repeat protein